MFNPITAGRRWSLEHRLLFGQVSCLLFGMGLILWGLAPTLIERVTTGNPPTMAGLAANLVCFLVAVMFIGFHLLMKHRVRWAAWAAFLISCVTVGGGLAISFATGFQFGSSFILVLSAITCFASLLSIEAIDKWPTEGPFAQAAGEDESRAENALPPRSGKFVAQGMVRKGQPHVAASEPAGDAGQTDAAGSATESGENSRAAIQHSTQR